LSQNLGGETNDRFAKNFAIGWIVASIIWELVVWIIRGIAWLSLAPEGKKEITVLRKEKREYERKQRKQSFFGDIIGYDDMAKILKKLF